mmetsp:Transcript_38555/g.61128  ORF Transcript_38555/g.61128 Transcript_38555/m.61128 type:complete len:211 (+) Transcript_38555:209-841(+)
MIPTSAKSSSLVAPNSASSAAKLAFCLILSACFVCFPGSTNLKVCLLWRFAVGTSTRGSNNLFFVGSVSNVGAESKNNIFSLSFSAKILLLMANVVRSAAPGSTARVPSLLWICWSLSASFFFRSASIFCRSCLTSFSCWTVLSLTACSCFLFNSAAFCLAIFSRSAFLSIPPALVGCVGCVSEAPFCPSEDEGGVSSQRLLVFFGGPSS